MPTPARPTSASPSAAPRRAADDRDLDAQLTAARRTEPGWFRLDLRVAVVTLLGGLLLIAVGLAGIWSEGGTLDPDRWWHAVPLMLGTAVMLVKRRRPMLCLAAGVLLALVDASAGGSLGMVVVVLDLLYSAALFSSRTGRRVLLVVAWSLVGAATVVAGVTTGGDPRAVVMGGVQAVGFLVVPLWWASNVRARSELAVLADERAALALAHAAGLEQIADLSRQEAVAAERRTMARDLHDVVAGHVSAIAIRTGAVLAGPPGAERETLEVVRATSLAALDEMRAMILLLRSDDRSDGPVSAPGTLDDLAALVEVHRDAAHHDPARTEGQAQIVLVDRAPRDLPAAVQQAALRIVQEALTNAARHGSQGVVAVVLDADQQTLDVRVTSPLRSAAGAPVPGGTGTGVLGMRERAQGLGGTLDAGPVGDSWVVRAVLPRSPGRASAAAGAPAASAPGGAA